MTTFWRTTILVLLAVVNVVLFYRMIWGSGGIIVFNDLSKKYRELEAELALVDTQNLQLSKEIRLLKSDDAYIEKMIRQRLHYVRKNEILYLFTEDELSKERPQKLGPK